MALLGTASYTIKSDSRSRRKYTSVAIVSVQACFKPLGSQQISPRKISEIFQISLNSRGRL